MCSFNTTAVSYQIVFKLASALHVPFCNFHLLHFVSKHDDVAVSVCNVLLTLQTVDGIGFLVTQKFDLNWWHPFDVLRSQLFSSFSF